MALYKALNTIKHKGETILPGAPIEVDGETEAWLLENGAIAKGVDVVEEEGEKALEDMNVAELKAYAEAGDISLDGVTIKADIYAAIVEAEAGEGE